MKWKIQTKVVLKKNIFLFVFSASFLLLISVFFSPSFGFQIGQSGASSFSDRAPANFIGNSYNNIIPAGTQMIIPPWIMQQYLLSEQAALYGDALNFLIYNYGVSAPSASDEDKDTYYVPLTSYKEKYDFDVDYDDDDSYQDTVMVDVTSLALAQPGTQSETSVPSPDTDARPGTATLQPGTSTQSEVVTPPAGADAQTETAQPPPSSTGAQSETPVSSPGTSKESETPAPLPDTDARPGTATLQPGTSTQHGTPVSPPAGADAQSGTITPLPEPEPRTRSETADSPPTITLITTKPVDTSGGPAVPEYAPEDDLSQPYTVSCEKPEEELDHTEARLPCVDCVLNLARGKTNQFLSDTEKTVNRFNRGKSFSALINTFCRSCNGVDIGDFVKYLEQRARSENVPPEIMLAIALRESNGDCNAGGDGDSSFGLFQLNTKNSTCLKKCNGGLLSKVNADQMKLVCKNGKHRKEYNHRSSAAPHICIRPSSPDPKICLNNPYCNFEEAFYLLKGEKWSIGNRGNRQKPEVKNWIDMSSENRNKWRNAIIAYNGAAALRAAESSMRANERLMRNELKMEGKPLLDNWEIKRMFFIKQYLKAKYPRDIIHNLAYVESITGREKKGGLANSSICQWIQFRKNNKQLSCH